MSITQRDEFDHKSQYLSWSLLLIPARHHRRPLSLAQQGRRSNPMMTLQAAPGRVAIAPRVGSTRRSQGASTPCRGPVASATRMHAVSWPSVAGASVPTGALPVAGAGRNAGRPTVTAHARISNDDKCVHDPTSIIPRPDPPSHDTVTTPTLKKKRVVSEAETNLPPLHLHPFPPPTHKRWYEAPSPPNFIDVRSEEELRDVMRAAYGNARASTLLVVEFYAKWCNSCRRYVYFNYRTGN